MVPSDASLAALLDEAVVREIVPGGQLVVGDAGNVVIRHTFGRTARVPAPGPRVEHDTLYDIASLSKPLATSAVLLRLVEALGFELARVSGSHRIYIHPEVAEVLCLQPFRGDAKPYQIRQLVVLVEVYNLSLRGRE